MPQSLANAVLHIVFSTPNPAPVLRFKEIRDEMDGYIVGTLLQTASDRIPWSALCGPDKGISPPWGFTLFVGDPTKG